MFAKYNALLKTHPYKTNMFTSGVLFGLGDGMAQYLFPHPHEDLTEPSYNYARTLRAAVYGTFFFAPCSVAWHGKKLPTILNPFVSARSRMTLLPKRLNIYDNLFRLTLDQLFVPALVWIPMYNIVMTTLAMHENPLALAREKLQNNWWNVLKANWTVWPLFHVLNLFFVPVHLRIFTANLWSVAWNSFLSFVHNTSGHGKGSGKLIEELVDIEDELEEQTMVYS